MTLCIYCLLGGKEKKDKFGWNERYKVALGVANALNYLHGHGNNQPVVHRDVKSSNILLSMDFEPKVNPTSLISFCILFPYDVVLNLILSWNFFSCLISA
jgi:serine/threonine protein kinase